MKPAWPLMAAWLMVAPALGCSGKPGDCLAGRDVSVARYDDCLKRCAAGEGSACDLRAELESGLSQVCHRSGQLAACKALCFGRAKDQSACQRARQMASGR